MTFAHQRAKRLRRVVRGLFLGLVPGLALMLGLVCSVLVHALPSDSEQDLLLESETLEYDEAAGTITYSGSVSMTQGSMKIEADTVVIYGNSDQATKVAAFGKPAKFQQTPNIGDQPVVAIAERLEYQVSDKSLLLRGNANLEQDGTSLKSDRIEYDVTRALVIAGEEQKSDNNERVRMVIPPKALKTDDK